VAEMDAVTPASDAVAAGDGAAGSFGEGADAEGGVVDGGDDAEAGEEAAALLGAASLGGGGVGGSGTVLSARMRFNRASCCWGGGKRRMAHASDSPRLSVTRLLLGASHVSFKPHDSSCMCLFCSVIARVPAPFRGRSVWEGQGKERGGEAGRRTRQRRTAFNEPSSFRGSAAWTRAAQP